MSLLSLSDEVLLGVIEGIAAPADMAALSLQCKRLYSLCDLTTRRKYRRIKLRHPDEVRRGFNMLLSILQRPILGTYVRQLVLNRSEGGNSFMYRSHDKSSAKITLPSSDLERLKHCIVHAGFRETGEEDAVLDVLSRDTDELGKYGDDTLVRYAHALAALIVSMSPNLQHLKVSPVGPRYSKWSLQRCGESDEPRRPHFFRHFMERANSKPVPYLQNLREIEFLEDTDKSWHDERFYDEYDVYGSLDLVRRLPAVESVSFNAIIEPEDSSVRIPPNSANYSKISMRGAILDFHTYCGVIESAKALKELTFTIAGRASLDTSHRIINPERVFRSLLLHRDTLEHLDFNFEDNVNLPQLFSPADTYTRYYYDDDDDDDDEDAEEQFNFEWADELPDLKPRDDAELDSIERPSLKDFTALKHLSLGVHLLYFYARGIGNQDDHNSELFSLADCLPPNLESLCIYGYEKTDQDVYGIPDLQINSHIAKFMAEKAKLVNLKEIRGVEECVPHERMVHDPDNQPELLWEREEEDWTEYEY